MHEAGIANRVLDAVVAAAPADAGNRPPRVLRLRVTDAAHLDVDAVSMHVEVALMERGWADVPVDISVAPVVCTSCDTSIRPDGAWPYCATCGAPLPEPEGAGIEVSASW